MTIVDDLFKVRLFDQEVILLLRCCSNSALCCII
jgi:hypothetical protein